MLGQAQMEAALDCRHATEIVMREYVDIINREGSEEELYAWRRSLKERYPGFYRDLLVEVRDRLDSKTRYAC